MYLLKKNTINFIKIKLILPLLLSTILFCNISYSKETFVGFIESLEGQVKKNIDGDLKRLSEYDQIFTNENIVVGSNSSINVSFIDNSTLTLNSESEFVIKKFDNVSEEKIFLLEIIKGKFTFESGSIAKSKEDAMKIILSEIEVILTGTLVSGENSEENKTIALVEDSMGKVGSLKITIGDQTTTISEPSAGINISGSQIQQTSLSTEETDQIKEIKKKALVKSSTQSEEDIDRALSKQLANGTIPDANGDGIADANDIEAYKNEIYDYRGERLNYFVEYSSGTDMGLMSDIIINSDPSQSMYLMQSMIDYDQGNTTFLMDEVARAGFDVFSHMAQADGLDPTMPYMDETFDFNEIRTSIVDGMILNQSEESIDTIARVMAVTDASMSTYLVDEISNITPQGDENFSIDILASFTEMAPEKLAEFYEEDPETMNKLTTNAFQNANEGDIEMMATIMQETSPKDTALLMTNLVENNPEMIAGVYSSLSEQDFDLFDHIESAKVQTGETVNVSIANDSMYGTEIIAGDQTMNMVVDDNVVAYQDEYFQNFKGEVFAEIIAHSEGTSSEIVAELMMDTTNGDTAMFMMEAVMNENPDVLTEVMNNFADQNFDIFEHIEETTVEDEDIDVISEQTDDVLIDNENTENASTLNEIDTTSENKIRLSKTEREALKAEKKAQRKAAKIAKQEKRKADRQAAIALRKAENKAARIAARQGNEDEIEFVISEIDELKEFKTEVFKEMIDNSDENTMSTMAKLVTTTDNSTASLIFETVISEQNNPEENTDNISNQNFALDFMDNLSNVDSEMVETIYETQTDLVNDIVNTALSDISAEDSDALANIISSSGSDEINELVFSNIASSNDQSLTTNVLSSLVDTDGGAEAIIAMATTNQSLYENIAQDVDPTYMTAAALYTNTTSQYNTSTTAADTMSASDTTTYAAGDISWTTYPMSPGSISTSYYVSITATAESMNGVVYSVSDLPEGLTLDYTTGMIFGTPSSPGTWNTTLTATDIMNSANFATASLTFDIVEDTSGGYNSGAGGSLSFMSTPYPPATLTVNNTITPIYLYTTGGVGNVTFTATGLPMGIFIMGDEIMGTPDTQTFSPSNVNIIATDEDGNTVSTNINFPIVNSNSGGGGGASGPVWASYLYPPATLTEGSEMMDMYLDATGTGSVSFSATGLPMGLYVDGEYIRGTPSMQTAYTSSVMITATDDMGSQTKYVTFPEVNASGGGGGTVTWNTFASDFPSILNVDDPISSVTLDATGSGAITYDYTGTLPPGLTFAAGIVSGTPTTEYEFTRDVTFTATDTAGNTGDLLVTFPQVDGDGGGGGGEITWTTTSADVTSTLGGSLTVDTAINSVTLSATGNGSITYSQIGLPPGLTLTAGLVSGTPTTQDPTGSTVTFTATDDDGNNEDLVVSFPPISASSGGSVTWYTTQADFPSTMTKGTAISSITLSATGSMEPITYTDDGNLPNGISLIAGVVSGTPQNVRATETTVTFTAEDMEGNEETLTVFFPIINAASGISNPNWITTPTTSGTYTTSSNISISAEAVSVPAANGVIYTASSLPPGVTLDTATGLISGTPSTAGTYNSEIRVEDATDSTFQITETLTFSVTASGGVTWNTTAVEFSSLTLTEGTPMSSINLSATGVGTISYADDAMLPAGISLVAGVVSGTPSSSTETETTVTFTAQDDNGDTETLTVSFPIINASGGGENITFDTNETLTSVDAGDSINETIQATASLGSPITYTFISVFNTGNSETSLAGTGITISGNLISGIAPRLFNAATYSFEFQASINAGATTNNKTFSMDISQDSTCVSPTNNICT